MTVGNLLGRRARQLEFLALLGHQIRAPMERVLGFARLLAEISRVGQERECAQGIVNSAEEVLWRADAVLDLACLEFGEIKMEVRRFTVKSVIDEVYCLLFPQARQRGICFEKEGVALGEMMGDARRLRQALVHLVSNAIQFANGECIRMRVSGDASRIYFSVEDCGGRIQAKKWDEIFDPFKNENGLRLVLAKRTVELMGGSLAIESDEGSRFSFHLPRSGPAKKGS